MTSYLLSVLLYLFSAILLEPSVPITPTSTLVITVVWDNDHNGVEEGVGPDIPVWIFKVAGTEVLSFTNENSQTAYNVVYGWWGVKAEVPPTHWFLVWVCVNVVNIDEPEEYLTIHCHEYFFVRLPWLLVKDAAEKE